MPNQTVSETFVISENDVLAHPEDPDFAGFNRP
jgi:hypothetical protein